MSVLVRAGDVPATSRTDYWQHVVETTLGPLEVLRPPATPLHLHTRYEERLFVVSGSLTAWIGHDRLVLRSGDYLHIPTDVPHAIQAGAEDTHALNITSPAGFAELVARAGTPVHLATPDTEFDADLFMAVTTELGDVVLGPPGTTPADLGR